MKKTQSIYLPCKNAAQTSIPSHFHPLDTIIEEANPGESLQQVGEFNCNISASSNPLTTSLALTTFHPSRYFSVFCKDPSHGYTFLAIVGNFLVNMVSFPISQISQFNGIINQSTFHFIVIEENSFVSSQPPIDTSGTSLCLLSCCSSYKCHS